MVDINSGIGVMNSTLDATFPMASELINNVSGINTNIRILTLIVAGLYVYFLLTRWWDARKAKMLMNEVKKELDNKPRFILKDAIEHIEPLGCAKIKNLTEIDCEDSGKKIAINNYPLNKYLKLINNNINPEFVFNHKARFNNVNDQEIYSILSQGRDATCDSISHIMPYAHRNHVFKDKYFKLIENNPSRTITAHMKMDCHSHIHPTQIRSLTPREAARIQSFPDNYIFLGPYLKTYMQIGNAVPPLMSKVFAKVYKKFL